MKKIIVLILSTHIFFCIYAQQAVHISNRSSEPIPAKDTFNPQDVLTPASNQIPVEPPDPENPPVQFFEYCFDMDGDGYGGQELCYYSSSGPWSAKDVPNSDDCDNSNPNITIPKDWYRDADGDGYGNPSISKTQCTQPSGYVLSNTDCNDNDTNVYPKEWYLDDNNDGCVDYPMITKIECYRPIGYIPYTYNDCPIDLNYIYIREPLIAMQTLDKPTKPYIELEY